MPANRNTFISPPYWHHQLLLSLDQSISTAEQGEPELQTLTSKEYKIYKGLTADSDIFVIFH